MRFSVSFIIVAIMNKKRQTEQVRKRKTDSETKQRQKCNLCKSHVIWWSCKKKNSFAFKTGHIRPDVLWDTFSTRWQCTAKIYNAAGYELRRITSKERRAPVLYSHCTKTNVWFGLTKSADVVSSRLFLSQVVCKWSTETLDRWQ